MEELLANTDPETLNLYNLISGLLLLAGIRAAFFLHRYHRRNPPVQALHTAEISGRAWSTAQVVLLLGSLFLLYFLTSFSGQLFHEDHIPVAQLAVTLLIQVLLLLIIVVITRRRGRSWDASYGMGFHQLKKLALAPVFYLAFLPFMAVATKAYHLVLQQFFAFEVDLQDAAQMAMGELSWLKILLIIMAVFVAPVFEELLFRGILFPYLVKRVGLGAGTAWVSLVFAAMHFHVPSLVPLYLFSAVLCLAYWRTGSLWVGIGMHTIFNAVTILALNMMG